MKGTIINLREDTKMRREEFLPHIFNYILKDEILQKINCVDNKRVYSVRNNISKYKLSSAHRLAEKIIEGN